MLQQAEQLKRFASNIRMKNLVIKCFRLFISYKLPHEGYDTVGFKAIDQNKDGIININELEEIVGHSLA